MVAMWLVACAPEVTEPVDAAPAAPVFAPLGDGDVPTVQSVDVARYLGTWFEIATFPILFQRACARTSATYGVRDEGGLTVFNQCRVGGLDGQPFAFTGKALPVDETNARLEVSFFGDAGAPYWVIERDHAAETGPYDWALVSDPTETTLWILHRAPQMDEALLAPLLERLDERGYDTAALSFTEQPAEAWDPATEP